jgi:hypothetical protein
MAPTHFIALIFIGLTGLLQAVNGYNFAIAESLTIVDLVGGGSYEEDLIFLSPGSESPGCCQAEDSSSVDGYPIPNDNFSGSVCGVNLNFYANGGNYVYYQANGDGTQLGKCTSDNAPEGEVTASCLNFGGVTTIYLQYSCTNYNQNANGVNPCTPEQEMETSC